MKSQADLVVPDARWSAAFPDLWFSEDEWRRIVAYYVVIVLLHVVGWGLYLHYAARYPAMLGLGLAAYLFGLRHAFDADHIAAVDDTVRYLMQKGKMPLGVGFFFSLGHSTVVFVLAVFTALMMAAVKHALPEIQHVGAMVGTGVSGLFLWVVGVLNLLVLLDLLKGWKHALRGGHDHEHLDRVLGQRGLLNRLFGSRLQRVVHDSWQMYPVGLLFGLGFDTASEIGLLAMTAGAATGNLPVWAVISLPILFTAGMSAMDTTDGILMTKAYGWAFVSPVRRIFYNLTTTGLSVLVALVLGTIELLQILISSMHWKGPVAHTIVSLHFGSFGYLVVFLFMLAWGISVLIWKLGRFGQRSALEPSPHASDPIKGGCPAEDRRKSCSAP
jgi:high-affinity nickel-transport protein